jgi:hypothetical protein
MMRVTFAAICAASFSMPLLAQGSLAVESYTMRNGSTGSWAYWDRPYNAGANQAVSNSLLTGGRGKLTDGVVATQNWNLVSNAQGTGEYVGWGGAGTTGINPPDAPVITTFFNGAFSFTRLRLWVDHSNGFGGVNPPTAVVVGGIANADWTSTTGGTTFSITRPTAASPFLIDLDISSLGLQGNSLTFRVVRATNSWVMMSEMAVDGRPTTVIPEPHSAPMLAFGTLLVASLLRRARHQPHRLRN